MSAALIVHHAMRLCYNVIFVLSDYTILFHIVSQKGRLSGEKNYWTLNVRLVSSKTPSENFLFLRRIQL
jgi:hypothetical protein